MKNKLSSIFALAAFFAVSAFSISFAKENRRDMCQALEPKSGQNINESLTGRIEGEIDLFLARIAGAEIDFEGEARKFAEDTLPKYQENQKLYVWERLIYLVCIDPRIDVELNILLRVFLEPPIAANAVCPPWMQDLYDRKIGNRGKGNRQVVPDERLSPHVEQLAKCYSLAYVNLSEAHVMEVEIPGAKLNNSNLTHSLWTGSNLSKVDLRWSNLTSAGMAHTNLSDAKLNYSCLFNANFDYADLTGAELIGADISTASFRNTRGLTQAQIESALCSRGDKGMPILPEGRDDLHPNKCDPETKQGSNPACSYP